MITALSGTVSHEFHQTVSSFDHQSKTKSFHDIENLSIDFDDGSVTKLSLPGDRIARRGDRMTVFMDGHRTICVVNERDGILRLQPSPERTDLLTFGAIVLAALAVLLTMSLSVFIWAVLIAALAPSAISGFLDSATLSKCRTIWQERKEVAVPRPGLRRDGEQCADCGAGISHGVASFCRARPERFGGSLFCMTCQKDHPKRIPGTPVRAPRPIGGLEISPRRPETLPKSAPQPARRHIERIRDGYQDQDPRQGPPPTARCQ